MSTEQSSWKKLYTHIFCNSETKNPIQCFKSQNLHNFSGPIEKKKEKERKYIKIKCPWLLNTTFYKEKHMYVGVGRNKEKINGSVNQIWLQFLSFANFIKIFDQVNTLPVPFQGLGKDPYV